jgi:hypothetical protein
MLGEKIAAQLEIGQVPTLRFFAAQTFHHQTHRGHAPAAQQAFNCRPCLQIRLPIYGRFRMGKLPVVELPRA